MAHLQYSTILEAPGDILDPRKARGKRHSRAIILLLVALGILSGEKTPYGISMWVKCNMERLLENLQPARGSLPSYATLRRALATIDLEVAKERLLGGVASRVPLSLKGVALDGKSIRGVHKFGEKVHLLSLVGHHPPVVLAQIEVGKKENEISAAPGLLATVNLKGKVVTADALLTQRALCTQIVDQGGDYLFVVKDNQPKLKEAIAYLFDNPPWTETEKIQEYQHFSYTDKGHGRIEERHLEASSTLNEYLDWPGLQQVVKRTTRRVITKTGEVTEAVTSLSPEQADAYALERLWRGHWTIENRVHYVRDISMGKDAGRSHHGNIPVALALFRNFILSLLRLAVWQSIPNAFRHNQAHLEESLRLLGFSLPSGEL